MTTLNSLYKHVKGIAVELHADKFHKVAGNITEDHELHGLVDDGYILASLVDDLSDDSKAMIETNDKGNYKSYTRFTKDFIKVEKPNRFGVLKETTEAKPDAEWINGNLVESCTIQGSVAARVKGIQARTFRVIKADVSESDIQVMYALNAKQDYVKFVAMALNMVKMADKFKANPKKRVNKEKVAGLHAVLENDAIKCTNKVSDLLSVFVNVIEGNKVKESADIF